MSFKLHGICSKTTLNSTMTVGNWAVLLWVSYTAYQLPLFCGSDPEQSLLPTQPRSLLLSVSLDWSWLTFSGEIWLLTCAQVTHVGTLLRNAGVNQSNCPPQFCNWIVRSICWLPSTVILAVTHKLKLQKNNGIKEKQHRQERWSSKVAYFSLVSELSWLTLQVVQISWGFFILIQRTSHLLTSH